MFYTKNIIKIKEDECRYRKLSNLSNEILWILSDWQFLSCFVLKSTITSFVLLTFRRGLFAWYHVPRFLISLRQPASLLEIRATTTVSSSNLMMVVELEVATASYVYSEYSKGLKTQAWGAQVLRVRQSETCQPTHAACGLSVRKLQIYLQSDGLSSTILEVWR